MRTKILLSVLIITVVVIACTDSQTTLVTQNGVAPYYTSLDEALAKAAPDQFVVAEFYTDW